MPEISVVKIYVLYCFVSLFPGVFKVIAEGSYSKDAAAGGHCLIIFILCGAGVEDKIIRLFKIGRASCRERV